MLKILNVMPWCARGREAIWYSSTDHPWRVNMGACKLKSLYSPPPPGGELSWVYTHLQGFSQNLQAACPKSQKLSTHKFQYVSLILLILNYCSYVYDGWDRSESNKHEVLQNNTLQAVSSPDCCDWATSLHDELSVDWLDVNREKSCVHM